MRMMSFLYEFKQNSFKNNQNMNMLQKILKDKDGDKKKLLENFIFLSILQASNYLLPLITFPYLVRVLGAAKFGLLAFAMAVSTYCGLLIDYGFNLSGTREVAKNHDNLKKLNQIFSSVMILKTVFCFVALFILTLTSIIVDEISYNKELFYLYLLVSILQFMLPTWFFLGIEEMKIPTFFNISVKFVATVLIFIFVKAPEDYLLVPSFYAFGYFLVIIYAMYLLYFKFSLRVVKPTLEEINYQFKEGWYIFSGILSTNTIYLSPIIILGLFYSKEIVGYYSIAENIMKAIRNLVYPMATAILPYSSRIAKNNIKESLKINLNVSVCFFIGLFFIVFFVYFFSDSFIFFISGEHIDESVRILNILLIAVPLHAIIHIFLTQTYLNLNMSQEYSRNFVLSAVIATSITILLVWKAGYYGAAYAYVFSEITLFIILLSLIWRRINKILHTEAMK